RVDDDERRPEPRDLFEDPLEAGFREDVERRLLDAEPLAAGLDLVLRFLAGAVEHGTERPGEMRGRLEQQRRLADPRLAAEQHQRSRHDAPAEHAIELADPRRQPVGLDDVDVGVELWSGRCRKRVALTGRCGRHRLRDLPLFDKRVPRTAVVTTSQPLRRLGAALLTGEYRLLLHVSDMENGRW